MGERRYISVPQDNPNPAIRLMLEHMAREGWRAEKANWTRGDLLRGQGRESVVHLHWPEAFWRSRNRTVMTARILDFCDRVRVSQRLGYKVVWSAHNVMPHESGWPTLDCAMRLWLLRNVDLVIGHARNCHEELVGAFGPMEVPYVLAPLGHYGDLYASKAERSAVRRALGIEDKETVVALLGAGRENKGDREFLEAAASSGLKSLRILILGDRSLPGTLGKLAPTVLRVPGYPPDGDLADLLVAVDHIALPYRSITTSAAFLLAVSTGKGVIAPNLPFFLAHCEPETALIYDHRYPREGIVRALATAVHGWGPSAEGQRKIREDCNWPRSARVMAGAFDRMVAR